MAAESTSTRSEVTREVVTSILLAGVAPFVIYSLMRPHTTEVRALIVAAIAPVLQNVITLARKHTIDIFGAFVLGGIILSVILVLLGGSPRLILIRESFLTGATGVAFLISLLLSRPLIYYFSLHFNTGDDPALRAQWASYWEYPYFRHVMRLMTVVWGVVTIVEALSRGYLVFNMPTQTFLAVSPLVQYTLLGGAVAWTIWYARRSQRVGERLRQERQAAT